MEQDNRTNTMVIIHIAIAIATDNGLLQLQVIANATAVVEMLGHYAYCNCNELSQLQVIAVVTDFVET